MCARTLFAAALLSVAAAPASGESPAPAAGPPAGAAGLVAAEAEVLALAQERFNRLTLPVLVEGAGPFAFMIDTGSQATAVTHEIRAAAALPPAGKATLIGMASRREVELASVRRIDFGTNSYTNFAAPVLAREHVGADGIIGLDALQDFRVLIDFRKQTIAVEDASVKEKRGGFEIVGF